MRDTHSISKTRSGRLNRWKEYFERYLLRQWKKWERKREYSWKAIWHFSLKHSSVSLYKVIGYAEVKCSVLLLNRITPPISNLAASTDSFNLPLCFSLSLSHRSLLLVLVKIASNMTEILVSFQRALGLSCIETEKEELYRSKCFNLFKKLSLPCDMDEAFLSACLRLSSVCCLCFHKDPFSL